MTDHLPECDMEIWMQEQMNDPYAPYWLEPPDDIECQCKKLRACEERVREDEQSNNFTPDDHANGMTEAYQRGLDAAREAVAVLPKGGMGQKAHELWRDALAAIDALRAAE